MLAVLTFHEQFAAFPGGFLGVDVFFVLSGYLITDLLVAQWDRRGQLDLRGFWVRRARRLLPALAVLLVSVTAAAAIIEPGQLGALRPALAAAVTYSSNWWQAAQHQSYFAGFGPPPPLQHLWSLAIEEQFYLVWPLILVAVLLTCRSRRLRAGVAWLAAAASALAMAAIYVPGADPSRVYYGTDTHASALLIGCALALSWPLRQVRTAPRENSAARRRRGPGRDRGAGLGDGPLLRLGRPSLYPAGLLVAALAAGGLVIAAAAPGLVERAARLDAVALDRRPLLRHLPVALASHRAGGSDRSAAGRPGWVWLIETALAISLAAASWRWIEQPIIRNGFRATPRPLPGRGRIGRRGPAVASGRAFPAVCMVAAVSVACTAGYGVLNAPHQMACSSRSCTGRRSARPRRRGTLWCPGRHTPPRAARRPRPPRRRPCRQPRETPDRSRSPPRSGRFPARWSPPSGTP